MGKKKKTEKPSEQMPDFGEMMTEMMKTQLEDAKMVNTISSVALAYVLSDFDKFIEWAVSIGMFEFTEKREGLQQDVITAYTMVRGAVDLATQGLTELGEPPTDDADVIQFPVNPGI